MAGITNAEPMPAESESWRSLEPEAINGDFRIPPAACLMLARFAYGIGLAVRIILTSGSWRS